MKDNTSNPKGLNEIKQRFIGKRTMVIFLAMLSAFPALTTDLYLPALPAMTKFFGVSESLTNMTLIVFFASFSVLTLVWGPVSDKYGRKPVMVLGTLCYLVASGLCAIAPNITVLIVARILQGGGGASAVSMATAIIKDIYSERKRETTLALVQSMVVVAPVVAPVIGALMLNFTNWRGIFVLQTIFGLIVFVGSFFYSETNLAKYSGSIVSVFGRLLVVVRNPAFFVLLIIFSTLNAAQLSFIGVSAYIFQDYYGLSSQVYSFFFAFISGCMIAGPFLYMAFSRFVTRRNIISACLIICMLSGIGVIALAHFGPVAFALVLAPSFIACSCIKPPGVFLMLEQQKQDTGSSSSLINSAVMIMGTIGVACASLTILDFVYLVGIINIVIGLFCLILWFLRGRNYD